MDRREHPVESLPDAGAQKVGPGVDIRLHEVAEEGLHVLAGHAAHRAEARDLPAPIETTL